MDANAVTLVQRDATRVTEAAAVAMREVVPVTKPAIQSDEPVGPKASDIDPNAPLVVRVLDYTGAPVPGVQVELMAKHSTGPIHRWIEYEETDALGLIEITRAEGLMDWLFHPNPEFADSGNRYGDHGLRCTMPFDEYRSTDEDEMPGTTWITAEPTPGQAIELVLPPTGWIEFTFEPVVGEDGTLTYPHNLGVRRSDGDPFSEWSSFTRLPNSATSFRFGPVGLGWEVKASIHQRGVSGPVGHTRAPGPTQPGETVVIPIAAYASAPPYARLTGRVTYPANDPHELGGVSLAMGNPEDRGTFKPIVSLDKNGDFALDVSRARLSSTIVVDDNSDRYGDFELKGRRTVMLDLSAPDQLQFDLGTITLQPRVPAKITLVSGHVRDTQNGAVANAWVSVQGQALSQNTKTIEANADGSQPWTDLGHASTSQDGSYTFDARVELASNVLRVRAFHNDCQQPSDIEVNLGDTDADLVLGKGGAVTLQVQLDPWVLKTDALNLRLIGAGRKSSVSLQEYNEQKRWRFRGLPPGVYPLQVELKGNRVLHEQEVGVVVGQTVDLGTIDLRGRIKLCSLALVDAHGQPIDMQSVRVSEAGSDHSFTFDAQVNRLGFLNLALPLGVGDLLLTGQDGALVNIPANLFQTPDPLRAPIRTTFKFAN